MAQNRQQPNRKKKIEATPPFDEELFATPASEPEYSDIFASLLDFASEPEPAVFDPAPHRTPPNTASRLPSPHFSHLQKGLLAGIILVAAALSYALLTRLQPKVPTEPSTSAPQQYTQYESAYNEPPTQIPMRSAPIRSNPPATPMQRSDIGMPNPEPLSLAIADKLYLGNEYASALSTYEKLYRRLPPSEDQQPLRDFLLLRMALCSKNTGDIRQADNMFRTVSLSRLPLLRALARYHQSCTLVDRERYLEAVTKAYQTLALIEVVDYDETWVQAVQRQCNFLVAESMTRSLLSLRDADANLPPALWEGHPDIDPFVNLDQPQLKVFLASGAEKLDEALLAPKIEPRAEQGRWSIICNGASIEELLSRFATNARFNIQWIDTNQETLAEDSVRRRPVYLYLKSATVQQAMTTAAGSVGLLARMDRIGNVKIVDPSSYASLAEHTSLLADESVSLWQRFLLAAEDDQRVPNGHFALGLLYAERDRPTEAIAEYKLVANRFAQGKLAPHALLQSGMLKVTLRDYAGAQQDLKQLVELYPDTELADHASLYLANATMKAGLYEEASSQFRKVYNLGLSRDSQTASALGAGRCFYETQDYGNAATWLNRYISLVQDQNSREFHVACLLLGKTYLALNNPRQAHSALMLAMKGDLSRQQYVETVAALVKTYIQQELYIEALNTLEGTHAWQLSQQETIDLLLLRSQVLRAIGLVDKAVAILGEKVQFLPSPVLKSKVALELTACYREQGRLEEARRVLSEAFSLVEPGPLAQDVGCELAQVSLSVSQPSQAISVCTQLLEHTQTSAERKRVKTLLAEAYRDQQKYDQAVSTLLDNQTNGTDATSTPMLPSIAP